MTYTVYNADGRAIAGDPILDDELRAVADEVGGYIVNEVTDVVVYEAG